MDAIVQGLIACSSGTYTRTPEPCGCMQHETRFFTADDTDGISVHRSWKTAQHCPTHAPVGTYAPVPPPERVLPAGYKHDMPPEQRAAELAAMSDTDLRHLHTVYGDATLAPTVGSLAAMIESSPCAELAELGKKIRDCGCTKYYARVTCERGRFGRDLIGTTCHSHRVKQPLV
jgi:hypothetical protein